MDRRTSALSRLPRPPHRGLNIYTAALNRFEALPRVRAGGCGSITELAAAEKIDRSYLCHDLRLTLLEIVKAILDGRQPEAVTLPALMKGFPMEWEKQPLELATS